MPPLLRLVHPFPSALNAAAVLAIAFIAGRSLTTAATLAAAMLGLQFCIGAVNDLFDERLDASTKPFKPIPAGEVDRRTAWLVAASAGALGLILATFVRFPDPIPLVFASAMLASGLVYDAVLKPTAFGWVCFAVALPLLPLYAWYGAAGTLPPNWEVLVPVAALAGPALQLGNGLIDLETDSGAGLRTFAVILGRRRSLVVIVIATLSIHTLAWSTLPVSIPGAVALLAGASGALAMGGVVASAQSELFLRQVGWTVQATSVAVLAVAWLLAAANSG